MPNDVVLALFLCPGGHCDRSDTYVVAHGAGYSIARLAHIRYLYIADYGSFAVYLGLGEHPFLCRSAIACKTLHVGTVGHSATESI